MKSKQNCLNWVIALGLALGMAATAPSAKAAQNKNKTDLKAEAQKSADEDAKEAAEGETGKQQRTFNGVFAALSESDPSQTMSPEVVGSFVTVAGDPRPNRTYLVKIENNNKSVLEALKRNAGKKVRVTGKLRVIGDDGEAKYVIVSSVLEATSTPRVGERRKSGGI